MKDFGAQNQMGQLVALALLRELGPIVTALMVAGRVGSAIAAELGSMVVSEQINALRALGLDPLRKLVAPRLFAPSGEISVSGKERGGPQAASKHLNCKEGWRRGWDSNPRWALTHSGFRDRCTNPLCDLSAIKGMRDEG